MQYLPAELQLEIRRYLEAGDLKRFRFISRNLSFPLQPSELERIYKNEQSLTGLLLQRDFIGIKYIIHRIDRNELENQLEILLKYDCLDLAELLLSQGSLSRSSLVHLWDRRHSNHCYTLLLRALQQAGSDLLWRFRPIELDEYFEILLTVREMEVPIYQLSHVIDHKPSRWREALEVLISHGADIHHNDELIFRTLCNRREPPIDIIEFLIQNGVNVQASKEEALMSAAAMGNCQLLNLLLTSGAYVNARQGGALVRAIGNLPAVELLIKHKANPNLRDGHCFKIARGNVSTFLDQYRFS